MAKNSIDAYGASGKTNLLYFEPSALTLVTDPNSPLYDERVHLPVDEALARNVDYQGVIEPILVSKNPETGDTEVVVGRQRVKAACLANEWRAGRGVDLRQIPAYVFKGSRRDAIEFIASENEVRQADTPLGRAEKMRRMMALGRGEEEVAVVFGCTAATVRATLSLLDCTSAVQKAVEKGSITVTQAKKLSKMAPDEQRTKVTELVAAGEGARPHERARKQRAVMGEQFRMKSRAQVAHALETAEGERAATLRWVLGMEEGEALPGLNAAKEAMAGLSLAA
ncbi:putative transcriptional regulator [Ralstonia pickettii OR214]|jgi:ParB family chromosome partitioning protein|uniref:Putative transcriptional regulator n=1 Tax=Ralstonia pickettii OR214 TaxID=1264675 RepID=R0CSS4_RALPI|nr:ParB/RepB/Spo0J family partition protein [Ralstonia pickettii]ENZ79601.1 putative transcriptional regulator [Ralstonia pickettii OR214]